MIGFSNVVEFNVMACYDICIIIFFEVSMPHCDYVKLMLILNDSCKTLTFLSDSCSLSLVF